MATPAQTQPSAIPVTTRSSEEISTESSPKSRSFSFIRGSDPLNILQDWSGDLSKTKAALAESLNAKNVAFLLGAGCSSYRSENKEWGIPTMAPLAAEFANGDDFLEPYDLPTQEEKDFIVARFGVNIADKEYAQNLERLMELLHGLRFVTAKSTLSSAGDDLIKIQKLIDQVHAFLWHKCTQGEFIKDPQVLGIYQAFYRKLVLRDRSLPRPWVFTTNYDLFNETAMDRLGLPYGNGFSGVIERRFNPATFRYALAEQLDLSSRKWNAVDGFVYLCKLHGSISWREDDHGLFPIREESPSSSAGKVMIYPTPAKQNASLGSPYSDLFREFQGRIVREQSILFTMGYAFGDEHINNIIFQALTIPTFRLVIFADPGQQGEIQKLKSLQDPRIWIIGGDGPSPGTKAHYFKTVVEHFLPERPSERIDEAVKKVIETFSSPKDRETQS